MASHKVILIKMAFVTCNHKNWFWNKYCCHMMYQNDDSADVGMSDVMQAIIATEINDTTITLAEFCLGSIKIYQLVIYIYIYIYYSIWNLSHHFMGFICSSVYHLITCNFYWTISLYMWDSWCGMYCLCLILLWFLNPFSFFDVFFRQIR